MRIIPIYKWLRIRTSPSPSFQRRGGRGGESRARGFTIIESLVAVAILLLALTGPMTLAERSLAAAEVARRELTVLYLAQEGMEFVRSVRDSNFLLYKGNKDKKDEKDKWLAGLDSCFTEAGCGVDLTETKKENQIIVCDNSDDVGNKKCLLTQNKKENESDNEFANGLFSHRASGNYWKSSGIHRKICITSVGDGVPECEMDIGLSNADEVKVNVIMTWDAGAFGDRKTVISSNLSNWYLSR